MEPKEKIVDTVCGYWCLYISSTSANEYSTQIIIIKKKIVLKIKKSWICQETVICEEKPSYYKNLVKEDECEEEQSQ